MSYAALFKVHSPSYRHNRVEWNNSWERQLAQIYGSDLLPASRESCRLDIQSQPAYDFMASRDDVLTSLQQIKQEICDLQLDLTKMAIRRFAERDMENQWICSTEDRRTELILEGLVRTCEATSEFEPRRGLCPETTVARLNRDSGAGYLDLLRAHLLPETNLIPEGYRTLDCAPVDWMLGLSVNASPAPLANHPGYKVLQEMNRSARAYFLSLFVWYTMLAFYGETEEKDYIKFSSGKTKVNRTMAKMIGVDPKLTAREIPRRACLVCRRTAEGAAVNALLSCSKCKAEGIETFYCGKDCQKVDWKRGHKKTCGSHDALLSKATSSSPPSSLDKTPALQHQLNLLKKHPEVDYFYIPPAPQDDVGIRFYPPAAKAGFRELWAKLVEEEDIVDKVRIVYTVFMMLEKMIGKSDWVRQRVPRERLKEQLNREFTVDMNFVLDLHGAPH
ncbi:hypothetical protein DL96DRAFT_1821847 [Flagelloscypha sp. PMI_526]|nr:hypothetical protein DL96DRAFT_1821847 [Flagelloscypha sp. PMI_526]